MSDYLEYVDNARKADKEGTIGRSRHYRGEALDTVASEYVPAHPHDFAEGGFVPEDPDDVAYERAVATGEVDEVLDLWEPDV